MKIIEPLDPEALRKHMAEQGGTAPAVATVDVSKIYQPADATTLRRPDLPPMPPAAPGTPNAPQAPLPAAAIYPQAISGMAAPTPAPAAAPSSQPIPAEAPAGPKKRVADREPSLKLYSAFVVVVTLLNIALAAYAIYQLRKLFGSNGDTFSAFAKSLLTIGVGLAVLPALISAYMLLSKSVVMVRVSLILLILLYVEHAITGFQSMFHQPSATVFILIGTSLWLAGWGWNAFQTVSQLED